MILDAYAVLAFLRDEPSAGAVERLLADTAAPSLTVVGVAEVLDRLVRLNGVAEDEAMLDLAQLGLADPQALDAATAAAAGLLRARRYHRTRCAVSLLEDRSAGRPVSALAVGQDLDGDPFGCAHVEQMRIARRDRFPSRSGHFSGEAIGR